MHPRHPQGGENILEPNLLGEVVRAVPGRARDQFLRTLLLGTASDPNWI